MKKLAAVLLVVLVAGCSNMGMRSGSSGGLGAFSSGGMSDRYSDSDVNLNNRSPIDGRTGNLDLYHGG